MEALSYTLAGDGTLHIHVNGVNKAVRSDASSYTEVMDALRTEDWEAVADMLTPFKDIEEENDDFEYRHGVMILTDDDGAEFNVPTVLSDEIRRYSDLGLGFGRLLTFAKNLNENSSNSSVQQLYGWLKETNLTLTEDGYFIGYRRVSEDWKDLHTGKHDNSIGATCKMRRNEVNENPSDPCSRGFHVATYDYAHNFSKASGGHVVAVKVHPKDVVAIPSSEHQKMRVCEFYVLEESFAEIDRPNYEEQPSGFPVPVDVGDTEEDENRCGDCDMFESDCVCEDAVCETCDELYDYCYCEDED